MYVSIDRLLSGKIRFSAQSPVEFSRLPHVGCTRTFQSLLYVELSGPVSSPTHGSFISNIRLDFCTSLLFRQLVFPGPGVSRRFTVASIAETVLTRGVLDRGNKSPGDCRKELICPRYHNVTVLPTWQRNRAQRMLWPACFWSTYN